ncbi:hypothetical protein [Metallosphaera hakonensis]|uniref:Glycosyltransferase family 1 protein n=1 Tax=Metallosphaera hakonensis JCM 8857 = DSM 7519 TaxID=1293036 RepID=A0A2U9IV93_9CREN|nr:hypothetical protein [Metallosphaera hakonensis]AWR99882.1 hypothetical protein DFR87_09490 [Metallosphaera hakonensis JCM 8857 = DSM 7519]
MTIYIAAPSNVYTGGPTALFQLCKILQNDYNVDTYIAFYNIIEEDPVHPNYKSYGCKWITLDRVEDISSNYIIIPESIPFYLLNRFHRIHKILYFLSVDNYVRNLYQLTNKWKIIPSLLSFLIKYYKMDMIHLKPFVNDNIKMYYNEFIASKVKSIIRNKEIEMLNDISLYLAQSKYAAEFLKYQGIEQDKILIIREPLEDEFIKKAKKVDLSKKENMIIWNSRKAYPIAAKLVKITKEKYKVYVAKNIGKEGMIELLSKTKIYLDIGIHPGRDRPPREAVALWNIPFVNNHGGLFYDEDFSIPSKLKLSCESLCNNISVNELYERIVDLMNNYDIIIRETDTIRQYIVDEPNIFRRDIEVFLNKISL